MHFILYTHCPGLHFSFTNHLTLWQTNNIFDFILNSCSIRSSRTQWYPIIHTRFFSLLHFVPGLSNQCTQHSYVKKIFLLKFMNETTLRKKQVSNRTFQTVCVEDDCTHRYKNMRSIIYICADWGRRRNCFVVVGTAVVYYCILKRKVIYWQDEEETNLIDRSCTTRAVFMIHCFNDLATAMIWWCDAAGCFCCCCAGWYAEY